MPVDSSSTESPCTEITVPEQNPKPNPVIEQEQIRTLSAGDNATSGLKATPVESQEPSENIVKLESIIPTTTLSPAAAALLALDERKAKLSFGDDGKPMLSDKGVYPIRLCEPLEYWDWTARGEMPVSAWLADWENSLARAGWIVIRKLPSPESEELPWEEMDVAQPDDSDLYCPSRNIYLSLLPSKIPNGEWLAGLLAEMPEGYPGSMAIIHARNPKKHFFKVNSGDHTVMDLLSKKSAIHCVEMGALVEFQGVLYEPDGLPTEQGCSLWKPTTNQTALEVYHEYRSHSLYYHEEQYQIDSARKESNQRLRERLQHRVNAEMLGMGPKDNNKAVLSPVLVG